jgi:type IV pilus assembly protein PilA
MEMDMDSRERVRTAVGPVGMRNQTMSERLRNQRGVTLVELMVVVAIIAIIAAIAITLYQDIQKKARLAADQGTIAALRSASAIYFGKNEGVFPTQTTLQGLVQGFNLQCPSATWNADTGNGKISYSPNDTSAC